MTAETTAATPAADQATSSDGSLYQACVALLNRSQDATEYHSADRAVQITIRDQVNHDDVDYYVVKLSDVSHVDYLAYADRAHTMDWSQCEVDDARNVPLRVIELVSSAVPLTD